MASVASGRRYQLRHVTLCFPVSGQRLFFAKNPVCDDAKSVTHLLHPHAPVFLTAQSDEMGWKTEILFGDGLFGMKLAATVVHWVVQ